MRFRRRRRCTDEVAFVAQALLPVLGFRYGFLLLYFIRKATGKSACATGAASHCLVVGCPGLNGLPGFRIRRDRLAIVLILRRSRRKNGCPTLPLRFSFLLVSN